MTGFQAKMVNLYIHDEGLSIEGPRWEKRNHHTIRNYLMTATIMQYLILSFKLINIKLFLIGNTSLKVNK